MKWIAGFGTYTFLRFVGGKRSSLRGIGHKEEGSENERTQVMQRMNVIPEMPARRSAWHFSADLTRSGAHQFISHFLTFPRYQGLKDTLFSVIEYASSEDSYTLSRTWTATDACGKESSQSQVITVEDTAVPTFNEISPADMTEECDAVSPTETLTADDTCDAGVPEVFNQMRTDGSCRENYMLTRVWTATDDCGNEVSYTKGVTAMDTCEPPATIATTQTFRADFRDAPFDPDNLLEELLYDDRHGVIKSAAPDVMYIYRKVVAPSVSFTITVSQYNDGIDANLDPWPNLPIQDEGQVILWDENCVKLQTTEARFDRVTGKVKFDIEGAIAGRCYFLSVKYVLSSLKNLPGNVEKEATYCFDIDADEKATDTGPQCITLLPKGRD